MKLAIIGATGLVGEEILKVLKKRNINFNKLYLVASKESVGKTIHFCNIDYNKDNAKRQGDLSGYCKTCQKCTGLQEVFKAIQTA